MSFTYIGNNSLAVTGATEIDLDTPASATVGDIIVSVYAFESVAAGSGPWIIPNTGQFSANYIGPAEGWEQVCWQTPGASGVGIEVWCAIIESPPAHQYAMFASSQNAVGVTVAYSGEYNPTGSIAGGPPRLAVTQQVTGNAPPAPSVNVNSGELIVACGGDLMTASKFGTPSGFTNRVDVNRGAAGEVEATIADRTATVAGVTGPITFPNSAASSTTAGATATLAIRPAPSVVGVGAVLEAPIPPDMDLPDGYKLVWAAIDPDTGADVSGVTVTGVSIFGTQLGTGTGTTQGQLGPYMLVPGPNA